MFGTKKETMVKEDRALAGQVAPVPTADVHFLSGIPLNSDVPEGMEEAMFGMGCFWGVERIFWQIEGVYLTMVGYSGGFTENCTYEQVCTGQTGHNEVVRIIFDPKKVSYETLLQHFWEGHNPTQGMRQGNDRGTQYRSGIYTFNAAQTEKAEASMAVYEHRLRRNGHGAITTEILPANTFYFAEGYHQQYLEKNPSGYCGIGGTGVTCPIGVAV
ncbi:peptide-methionine (S)-S-oxide reductase MsrA [Falsihalocynthiibacter arcticus]|uniref:Peptide methionine sulfoxide reductase MsrA n=1 Tax=Falsihalocynthiibacter arcticus TaxID=1579316 RepID=A0A126UW79_9RHOB|nr:peptide-methionine (S)-S-oxide reductase MsrA [Falsihalocynthiibacter arcticus]AML50318.1 peptide-methionine (S)-S-oxide reductase [Falsihalocynthiibacter arcticus]